MRTVNHITSYIGMLSVLWISFVVVSSRAAIDPPLDVVIVGAGASGLAAAASLLKHGKLKIEVVEARNYTGGRVHASYLNNVLVEHGANWLHGIPSSSRYHARMANPEWQLAQKIHLSTRRVIGSSANTSGYSLFHANGSLASGLGGHDQALADEALACANRTAAEIISAGKPDISFVSALTQCAWPSQPPSPTDSVLRWEITAADQEIPGPEESLTWALPDATYQFLGPG